VAQLRAAQDATLDELRAAWETAAGVTVSIATMSRAIKRLKWTRKKTRAAKPP
jgi:transposase